MNHKSQIRLTVVRKVCLMLVKDIHTYLHFTTCAISIFLNCIMFLKLQNISSKSLLYIIDR